MMQLKDIKSVYFIGIGGIGMSAIARFFKFEGKNVAGYDRTSTVLTQELEQEKIDIHYDDNVELIDTCYKDKASTLIVYTPAVPDSHTELQYFKTNGFTIQKRAEVLGLLTHKMDGVCVAGTHGKTTISTMTAHLYTQSEIGCNAFLGGISNNYKTNFLHNSQSPYVVLEADEFDRSFLHLKPQFALISAMDADHLDIYGDEQNVRDAFNQFVDRIQPGGALVYKEGLPLDEVDEDVELFSYSLDGDSDIYATNIKQEDGLYRFDMVSPFGKLRNLKLGVPGLVNVENAVGAVALALLGDVEEGEIRDALAGFQGIRRRFEYKIKEENLVMIDDYAHHPEEINATLASVKDIYPDKKISVVFQPHLYTRTRDFADGFAKALDVADQVYLLDIYPARELPIEGVTSEIIRRKMKLKQVEVVSKAELLTKVKTSKPEVLLTLGAGDIDKLVPLLADELKKLIR